MRFCLWKLASKPASYPQLHPEYRKQLEAALREGLRSIHRDTAEDRDQLNPNLRRSTDSRRNCLKLTSTRRLRGAMKKKQQEFHREETRIKRRLEAIEAGFDGNVEIIALALDLAEDMATTYRTAPDHLKRQLNRPSSRGPWSTSMNSESTTWKPSWSRYSTCLSVTTPVKPSERSSW